jgi:hypothetical protein
MLARAKSDVTGRLSLAEQKARLPGHHGHHQPPWPLLQASLEEGGAARQRTPRPQTHLRYNILMAGKYPKYVQERLGHAIISITLDTYSHPLEGTDGRLGDAIDEAL